MEQINDYTHVGLIILLVGHWMRFRFARLNALAETSRSPMMGLEIIGTLKLKSFISGISDLQQAAIVMAVAAAMYNEVPSAIVEIRIVALGFFGLGILSALGADGVHSGYISQKTSSKKKVDSCENTDSITVEKSTPYEGVPHRIYNDAFVASLTGLLVAFFI